MGGCDDGLCATDGLPSVADAPLQRSELAKSAKKRHRRVLVGIIRDNTNN
jgi:hypothetical protein